MTRLLIIDDDSLILDCFRYGFTEPDYTVATAASAAEGIDEFRQATPDVVLLDIRLPDMSGLDAFRCFYELDPRIPIILMTGKGTAQTAIEAMRLGAFEYILKPFDPDALGDLIQSAAETCRMMRVPALMSDCDPSDAAADDADLLVGRCPAMQEVYRSIGRVAPKDVTVLILGESGTGKEVVARAIYHYSLRASERFLAVNCAAIPETLLESELFGHEKGAFTGATHQRIGKFELCDRGTLFLDEIGDMTPLMQAKILRVLQDQRFERVGGNATIGTHARIITATNRDLEKLIAERQFRSDLFYRLNVYTIRLPPLRERGDDVPLLVQHFLRRFSRELHKEMTHVAPEAMELLCRYSWPGNVRELQSVLKHAMLHATGPILAPAFLPPVVSGKTAPTSVAGAAPTLDSTLAQLTRTRLEAGSNDVYAEVIGEVERHLMGEALRFTGGNLTQAAQRLGISRTTLRAKLSALGLIVPSVTADESRAARLELPALK